MSPAGTCFAYTVTEPVTVVADPHDEGGQPHGGRPVVSVQRDETLGRDVIQEPAQRTDPQSPGSAFLTDQG
jgi:hypothetical protein